MKQLKIENLKLTEDEIKTESAKVTALTQDDVENASFEDILHNIAVLETAKQISEKEIEALKVSSGLVSLEDAKDKVVDAIKMHIAALKPEDLEGEELYFTNLSSINDKADKVTALKAKEVTVYKPCEGFNITTFYNVLEVDNTFAMQLFLKALSKLTATEQKNFRTTLNNLVNFEYIVREVTTNVTNGVVTKQLSLDDMDTISISLALANKEGGED